MEDDVVTNALAMLLGGDYDSSHDQICAKKEGDSWHFYNPNTGELEEVYDTNDPVPGASYTAPGYVPRTEQSQQAFDMRRPSRLLPPK